MKPYPGVFHWFDRWFDDDTIGLHINAVKSCRSGKLGKSGDYHVMRSLRGNGRRRIRTNWNKRARTLLKRQLTAELAEEIGHK